jgi:hypothetical protein
MRLVPTVPPRVFEVDQPPSVKAPLFTTDCGRVALDPDEQITFLTDSGAELDVARKSWGYYAMPSLNARLVRFHLRAVLVKDDAGRFVLLLVERGKEGDFHRYLEIEGYSIVCWLDSTEALESLERKLTGAGREV